MDRGTEDNLCLVNIATTQHYKKSEVFLRIGIQSRKISTIVRPMQIIEGSGRAHMMLSNGTRLLIKDVLFSRSSRRNLISFNDIRMNGYRIETVSEGNKQY